MSADSRSDAFTGGLGFGISAAGFYASMQQILLGMQILAAMVSITVGILTIIKLARKKE